MGGMAGSDYRNTYKQVLVPNLYVCKGEEYKGKAVPVPCRE